MYWKQLKSRFQLVWRSSALRQAAITILTFNVILLLAGAAVWLLVKYQLDQRLDTELRTLTRTLAAAIQEGRTQALQLAEDPSSRAAWRDAAGAVSGDARLLQPGQAGLYRLQIASYQARKHSAHKNDDNDDTWRVLIAPHNGGLLAVGKDLSAFDEPLDLVLNAFLILSVLVSMLTLAGGVLIAQRSRTRYQAIANALEQIAQGNLSYRINAPDYGDDLGAMADHIDTTTERLQSQVQQIRQLSVNLAHDLKTPLARLRARLEQALDGIGTQQAAAHIEVALKQNDTVIEIFEAILRIARLESGAHAEQFVMLDLGQLAQEIGEIYQSVVEGGGKTLLVDVQQADPIRGDRELIIQMAANLIENAIRYAPEASTIHVAAIGNALKVIDNGPGIPERQREHVLKPMVRLDTSRHLPGTGLGLSMVKAIADIHHAQLDLNATDPTADHFPGLTVTVTFPTY